MTAPKMTMDLRIDVSICFNMSIQTCPVVEHPMRARGQRSSPIHRRPRRIWLTGKELEYPCDKQETNRSDIDDVAGFTEAEARCGW